MLLPPGRVGSRRYAVVNLKTGYVKEDSDGFAGSSVQGELGSLQGPPGRVTVATAKLTAKFGEKPSHS